jgi:4-amino-4-deoxy-L-arabinose transferase-like glycosyltransferase
MRPHLRLRRVPHPALLLLPLLVLVFAVHSLRLDATPVLNPDEAAYTEPALTLLTAGRFGAPMYAGLLAIDQRWYFLWPGYAILAAVPYALLGVDVLAVRVLSLTFGALLVAAVWWLTREVAWTLPGESWPGASGAAAPIVAVVATGAALLAFVHPTLFVLSRFGRPEIAVASLAVLSSALGARSARRQESSPLWAAAAGAAAAHSILIEQ